MTTEQFDPLGLAYQDSEEELLLRRYCELPSLFSKLGDLSGLAVLDIGCGSGGYARRFKLLGADRVVGIDISEGMVAFAREREEKEKLGIEYECRDMANVSSLGPFDLIVGSYVLPYANSVEHLYAVCRSVADALTPTGRFVAIPLNPDFSADPDWYAPYGATLTSEPPRTDGVAVTLVGEYGGHHFSVNARYWSRATHEDALRAAGFTTLDWSAPLPSEAGIDKFGADFWEHWVTTPSVLILDCRKSA